MLSGSLLHYRIIKELGRGGMGVVYLAEDLKLERKVAVKILPKNVSGDPDAKKRFLIEAKAAAALNHPAVATVYGIEETGEDVFIVMEYIEGIELKDKINAGPLQIDEALNTAAQIAEGLNAAHMNGIVHRDVKSQNIMITKEGKVKITDFGLAKVKGGSQLTKVGTAVGTSAYMSPEQTRGEEIDHRTDIWSFGVVLYEMLTGNVPFAGDYEQAVMYMIMNERQKPASFYRSGLPNGTDYVIDKCLEKDPGKRYKDFKEILSALDKLRSYKRTDIKPLYGSKSIFVNKYLITAVVISVLISAVFIIWLNAGKSKGNVAEAGDKIKMIAVLPFNNIKNDPDTNYLGFALADQIIGSLAYVKNIVVRPASSIRQYQGKIITPIKAGNQLKVSYILDGSYLENKDIIRLYLELVNVHNDEIVWKKDFDVKYVNTFKLQDLVAQKVTAGLEVKFSLNKINKSIPRSSEAYEYYLKAISTPSTMEGNKEGVSLLKKALRLDSTYAPAYVLLGDAYDYFADFDPEEKGMRKEAENAYLKALSLNKNSLDAINHLAGLYTESGKDYKAVKLLQKALKINPENPEVYFRLGYIFRYTGLQDKAVQEMEKARKLDPNNSDFSSICITYVYSQRYKDAIEALGSGVKDPFILAWKGQIYLRLKKTELAKKYLTEAIKIDSATLGHWAQAMLYYLENKRDKAINALKIMDKSNVYDGEVYYNYANLYGLLDDAKDCMRLLKTAINHGFFNYQVMLNDPFLDPVRNAPGFKGIIQTARSDSEKFKDELIDNSLLG